VDSQGGREKERERERKRGDLDHLSVHQWIRSAIRDSQQPTSPIGFLFLKLPPPPCAVLLETRQKGQERERERERETTTKSGTAVERKVISQQQHRSILHLSI